MNTKNAGSLITTTLIAGGFLIASAGPAAAATVSLCGPSVCYDYDDAQAGIDSFGAPTLVGDSLRFLPTTFAAAAPAFGTAGPTSTGAVGLSAATFLIDRAYTVGGESLNGVSVHELGDYVINGSGEVLANLMVVVSNNDEASAFNFGQDGFGSDGDSGGFDTYELNAEVSLASGLLSDAAISIQNTLFAVMGDDESDFSFIQKKGLMVSVAAVPLPATAWLLLPGLAWLGRRAWRSRET